MIPMQMLLRSKLHSPINFSWPRIQRYWISQLIISKILLQAGSSAGNAIALRRHDRLGGKSEVNNDSTQQYPWVFGSVFLCPQDGGRQCGTHLKETLKSQMEKHICLNLGLSDLST